MKLQKLPHLIALGSLLAFATAGCRHTPVGVTPIHDGHGAAPNVGDDAGPIKSPNPDFNRTPPPIQAQVQPPLQPTTTSLDPGTSNRLPSNPPVGVDTTKPIPISDTGIPPIGPDTLAGYTPNADILRIDTIYFDYDKSSVKASEESKLNEVVTYLKANPANGLRVEGNCDERGTDEYNRSLGDRRAMAAREYLVSHGVDPKMVLTVSYGKDKPADTGHNDEAWSKNRRDDFVVLIPPTTAKP